MVNRVGTLFMTQVFIYAWTAGTFSLWFLVWKKGYNMICRIRCELETYMNNNWKNKVSPWRDVTVLARRAVSAAHSPGPAAADRPRARQPARQPVGSVTDDDRCQRVKQYLPIRRASSNRKELQETFLTRAWPIGDGTRRREARVPSLSTPFWDTDT